jgi:phosphoribosylformylglycinamidine synthase
MLPRGHEAPFALREIPIRELSDEQLTKLSRDAHLFLSLEEMRAIRDEYRRLGREPRDIELETLAQTWSEHCVHKTLKSTVRFETLDEDDPILYQGRPGVVPNPDGSFTIQNLLKSTVAAATFKLIDDGIDWTLSVFKDNSGVVEFDERWGVCIKVETHNHPSALEPYGGAATGIGGCIRDVIGTGLGAKPIASTDVFCVAPFDTELPPGVLHPRRTLSQVVAGVRDYGNRMGIPTVNGAVQFDPRYVGNPLVFCGCVGLIPRDKVKGQTRAGDRIIALGGRTGRDGIHGATFSSAELEHTSADEFSHAVQIGNAIEEKRVLDAILRARDAAGGCLYSAMTDCGAGGFSSAVGEMGSALGARVELDRAPLKYAGLTSTEIWISEAQERMVLAVPARNVPALRAICAEENVELADLGEFGTPNAELILNFRGTEVGRMSMEFLHEGIPTPTREARWNAPSIRPLARPRTTPTVGEALLRLLSHPTIASKQSIIRQYDHEVQGATVVKPLVGPLGAGPSDAAVIEPLPAEPSRTGFTPAPTKGIALACGLATNIADPDAGGDPYQMALAGIDECVRNLVCVGADPARIAILDNFCWPSCGKPENLGSLVRAALGCYDGALAYRTPFVSGKDSLNNQFTYHDPATGQSRTIEIPPTLLITGLGLVRDTSRCVTSDAKEPGNQLVLLGLTDDRMGGSLYRTLNPAVGEPEIPTVHLDRGPSAARAVHQLIRDGLIRSAHDCSEGGLLVAAAEMLIGSIGPRSVTHTSLGLDMTIEPDAIDLEALAFAETPSRYLIEVRPGDLRRLRDTLRDFGGVFLTPVGVLDTSGHLKWPRADLDVAVGELAAAWAGALSI